MLFTQGVKGGPVDVQFRTRKLRKQYEDHREAERAYGRPVARRYIERVNIMKHAWDIEELQRLPGLHCHPLKGPRQGQWALKLTGFHRLIFTLEGDQLAIARIEEVSKHYGD
jgi:proteic killer suppression protein